MKKFTLTLIAVLFVTVGAFAQQLDYSKKISRFKAKTFETAEIIKGFDLNKFSNKGRRAIPVTSFYTPDGYYEFVFRELYNVGGDLYSEEYSSFGVTVISYGAEQDSIKILGLFDEPVLGAISADGSVEFPIQMVGKYYGYYPLYLCGAKYNDVLGEIEYTTLKGNVVQDRKTGKTSLILDVNLTMDVVLDAGSFQYDWYIFEPGSKFDMSDEYNGIMEVTFDPIYSGDDDAMYPVKISQNGNVVSVDNFMGLDNTVNITLNSDKTISIPKQFVFSEGSGSPYGDFYTYAADYSIDNPMYWSDFITGEVIEGKGDEAQISWGNFILFSTTEYVYNAMASAKIYYASSTCKRYNYAKPENASAPRFNFDQNLTGIQNAKTAEAVGVSYVDMAGRQVTAATKGVVLKTTKYADGSKKTVKVVRK